MTKGPKPAARRPRQAAPPPTGELALIRAIQARATTARSGPQRELQLGIGDDCAILRPRPREEIVVTTDFSLEGRHFRRDWHSPASIGHRTLARGLSDLAAMGARPMAAFLSLALPRSVARNMPWVDAFLDGLLTLARRIGAPLAGGDTSESPSDHVLADIVLLGAVPQGQALRRDGARPGDRLFVTGSLGGAALQLQHLQHQPPTTNHRPPTTNHRPPTTDHQPPTTNHQPHFFPEPRLEPGLALRKRKLATAAMDLSDGLSTDLRHLCEASQVCAELDASAIPLHPLLAGTDPQKALHLALHGGEDYELLFTARPNAQVPSRVGGVPATEIGRIVSSGRGRPRVTLITATGRRKPLAPAGWEHLR